MLHPLTTTLTTLSLIFLIASATPPTLLANVSNTTNATTANLRTEGLLNESAKFAPLLPPLYRHVSAGGAWIFNNHENIGNGNSSARKKLAASDLSCECFDPGGMFSFSSSSSSFPFQ